jgi:UDP-N-acetylglucosamine diphosphorylase / glucose-1-phosphate thymidylyltransferase / UDP-N-acetylgalactosamine diphosphorylase / glucosamine-1-phosphate N-acetyltransferase / galactosamine-1-phosphate N-acetyltransferase
MMDNRHISGGDFYMTMSDDYTQLGPHAFFDLSQFAHRAIFDGVEYVWEALAHIPAYVDTFFAHLDLDHRVAGEVEPGTLIVGERITVASGAVVEAGVQIRGRDIYIGPGAVLEAGAYLKGEKIYIGPGALVERAWLKGQRILVDRGAKVLVNTRLRDNVIIGEEAEAGFSADIKNAVFLPRATAAHFVYAGDSLVGRGVNLADKTTLSNLRHDGRAPRVRVGDDLVDTGLRKFGAVIGDGVRTGCVTTTNPGTLVGPGVWTYDHTVLSGVIPANTIVKHRQTNENVVKGG